MPGISLPGQIIILVLLAGFSFIMSRYDLRSLEVPDWPYWASCILVIIARLVFYRQTIYHNIISALIFLFLYYFIRLITRGHLGIGDVYFGIFQGLCIGPAVIWICLAVETVTGLLAYWILYLVKKTKGIKMPFIPFMSFGLLTAFMLEWLVL